MRTSDPPLRVAWTQAIAGIRVRLARHTVTIAGVGLGIAFFCSVQASRQLHPGANSFESERLQWMAITSLLMCLVGVTNAMLMSVTERYRELGTIKCLGASDAFIIKVFFLEALVLGGIGSLFGSLLGSLAMALFDGFALSPILSVIGTGTFVGMAMTTIAAIAPAIRAAKMPAAAALRAEV